VYLLSDIYNTDYHIIDGVFREAGRKSL